MRLKCKELRPYQREGTTLREILLHAVTGCNTVLHGVPYPDPAPARESSPQRKKKEKKKGGDARLAPLPVSEEVIGYLNNESGGTFKPGAAGHRKLIQARLNDGATVEDLKTVIRKKCAEWVGTRFATNLKPSCLFRASNFDGYLGQPEVKEGQQGLFGTSSDPRNQRNQQDYTKGVDPKTGRW